VLQKFILGLCLVLWLSDIASDLSDGTSALDDYSPGVELVDKIARDGGHFSSRTGDRPPGILGFITLSDPFGLYHPEDVFDPSPLWRFVSPIYGREIFSLNHVLLI